MRGFLYEISKDKSCLGELTADEFASKEEERQIGAEWYSDAGPDDRSMFLDETERLGADIVDRMKDQLCFVFTDDMRRNYFAKRFEQFMKYIRTMADVNRPKDNMAIFSSDTINELQRIIEDPYSDAVWLADESKVLTMDAFMRTAEAGTTYYVGNVVGIH